MSALAASQAERDALAGRCVRLELLLAGSRRPSLAGRLTALALLALARLR